MGSKNGIYNPEFPRDTVVRVVARERLEDFQRNWKLHNPITDAQLDAAGVQAKVANVGFYHGGDELYTLQGLPGIWHECCLEKD